MNILALSTERHCESLSVSPDDFWQREVNEDRTGGRKSLMRQRRAELDCEGTRRYCMYKRMSGESAWIRSGLGSTKLGC
jgi:hypothetical protein